MKRTFLSLMTMACVLSATAQKPAYADASQQFQAAQQRRLNAEQRADALLKKLTLEEKVQLIYFP